MISLFTILHIVIWYWCIKTTDHKGYGPLLGLFLGLWPLIGGVVVLLLPTKEE